MPVPNTNTFSLQDVIDEIENNGGNNVSSLSGCFSEAIATGFDSNYEGSKDRLSNFRNYSHLQYSIIQVGKLIETPAEACGLSQGTSPIVVDYGDTLITAQNLYADFNGTLATAGFYSDGQIYRQWNGSTFILTSNCNAQFSIQLRQKQCVGDQPNSTYWMDTNSLSTATKLYKNDRVTLADSSPYYNDGLNGWRNWNGTSFTNSLQNCGGGLFDVDMGYDATSSSSACNDYPNNNFYMDDNSVALATVVYQDSSGLLSGASGWYSDGSDVRFWNGTTFTSSAQVCI